MLPSGMYIRITAVRLRVCTAMFASSISVRFAVSFTGTTDERRSGGEKELSRRFVAGSLLASLGEKYLMRAEPRSARLSFSFLFFPCLSAEFLDYPRSLFPTVVFLLRPTRRGLTRIFMPALRLAGATVVRNRPSSSWTTTRMCNIGWGYFGPTA